jgi:hypothetical protein
MYPSNFSFVDSIAKECIKRGGEYDYILWNLDFIQLFSVALYPGAKGTFDGTSGDHILIAPPFTIAEQEIVLLVDTLKTSIDVVLNSASEVA